ncbi:MAG TPA: serine/threonine protein kinase [Thermoanaerobaculia bacterium]|nr:serine/threonine protein kinase [Thermoanaerobaculia bacterium]
MKLPRLGLLTRVALALGAVGLLPLAISWFGLVGVNREALFDQTLHTHALAARTAADRAEAFLDTRLSLARGMAANRALADPRSPAAQELLAGSLQAWADLDIQAVAVVNAQGEEVVRAQLKGAPPGVAAALRLPGVGAASSGPVTAVPGAGAPAIRISAPLPGGAGTVVLVSGGSALAGLAHPEELGGEADLAVADRGGRVVVGDARSLSPFPRGLIDAALAGRVAGAGRFRGRGGEEVLGAYAPVETAGWAVMSSQPARVAEAVAARLRWQSVQAFGAALLLIALLLAVAWAAVVRPIRDLAREQRELAKVGPVAAGRDEIDDLRKSFEALRRGLAERRALDDVFLGRYQVVELLATGGMGAVFRGLDPRLQRPVALKTLRLGDLPPEKRRQRTEQLVREAVTAARFSHPNVVAVYDVEESPEGAYIAMELVDGISLERLLLQRGRLRPAEVIPLGAAIARGLAAAHGRDIVHRDVKPANVMLGRDGSIKVTDFGIADLIAASIRAEGLVFGTPGYLPPEALRGAGHNRAGDLFALGVVLYECLAGVKPFGGGLDVSDIVQATLFGAIRPLGPRVEEPLPRELEALVLDLLERDNFLRPANAAAVADELDRMAAASGLRWRLEERAARPAAVEFPEFTVEAQWVETAQLATEKRSVAGG